MDWLRKHWLGLSLWIAGIAGTAIAEKIADRYFELSIFVTFWSFLVRCWELVTGPVSIPIWILTALLVVTFVHAVGIIKKARTRASKRLNEDQQFVLHGIGVCNTQHAHEPTLDQISEMCGLTLSVTERIADQLRAKGLMRWDLQFIRGQWGMDNKYEERAQMTKAGRDYLLDAGIDPSNPNHCTVDS